MKQINTCPGYFVYLFPNKEVKDLSGNLITICLKREWRRKGVGNVIVGALLERMSQVASTGIGARSDNLEGESSPMCKSRN